MAYRKKLIEVSLPLEAINIASAREEIHPAWTSLHVAFVVGAPTAGSLPCGVIFFIG